MHHTPGQPLSMFSRATAMATMPVMPAPLPSRSGRGLQLGQTGKSALVAARRGLGDPDPRHSPWDGRPLAALGSGAPTFRHSRHAGRLRAGSGPGHRRRRRLFRDRRGARRQRAQAASLLRRNARRQRCPPTRADAGSRLERRRSTPSSATLTAPVWPR